MIIADSCYSAAIFRNNSPTGFGRPLNHETLTRMVQQKSRIAISSGGLEPVPDSINGSKNSIFATSLARALNENDHTIAALQLYGLISNIVVPATSRAGIDQTPQYSSLLQSGHKGGDFIFARTQR